MNTETKETLKGPGNSPVSQTKVLFQATPRDLGTVERPMLAPHLEARPIGEDVVLAASESFNGALYGKLYADLLPLLDGSRSRHEVAAALDGKHDELAVRTALVSLASRGYVVSGEFAMDRGMAAFWSSCGVSPLWAEERLQSARVAVTGDGDRGLVAALERLGIASTADDPTLAVTVTKDYLDEDHAETNRRHLASGLPWALLRTGTVSPLFGPVFRPGDNGPCWACLTHRLRGNREVESFLRGSAGGGEAHRSRVAVPVFEDAVFGLTALEIAKWIVFGEYSMLHENVITLEPFTLGSERHQVMRRPQCFVCGDEALYRPDRDPTPVELRTSPKPIHNSGGLRSVPPEETVRQYRHLVSPISGVVTQLLPGVSGEDSWLHVYWAGSNLALSNNSLHVLRNSLRTKSSGKGSTVAQAEASALCEAVERYSGVFHGDEIRRRARLEDFADGEAMHPNDVQLFSDWQFANSEEINSRHSRFNYVPTRLDPTIEMDWTPVWSLTAQRYRHLPTSMLYFSMPLETNVIYCGPDSNGNAAGNTLEEAILQGFFELVERDAFGIWWYNRARVPEVDIDSFGDAYLSSAREYYARHNRELWVLDVTNDMGIPAFVAVSRRTDKEVEDILYSGGAHMDPQIAALRAVCELNQYLGGVRDVKKDGTGYLYDDPESLWWWQNAKIKDHPYLVPDPDAPKRGKADYPVPPTTDLKDDVEHCRALVERKGMEFMVLDQTRPDIKMPVAKVIVPGMRHFWMRSGPGRLYDVPVEMGWLEKPTAEADLNPYWVFI